MFSWHDMFSNYVFNKQILKYYLWMKISTQEINEEDTTRKSKVLSSSVTLVDNFESFF